MTDPHTHLALGGGLLVLALGNLLAFLRTVAALAELASQHVKLRENQQTIATKVGVELPHPPPEK